VRAGRAAVAPLSSPPFRRYLLGQLPSLTGSWAQVVALSWWVESHDPKALGWVVALQFLPSLLLGPWFGVVADRHDRRRLLMLAECGLGLVAAAYALASLTGVLTLPVIYGLATAWGMINALDTPARRALVPGLVPPDQAASASALTGTALLIGMAAGSALGGVLAAAADVAAAFAVNAASFLADVAVLSTIRVGKSPQVKRAPRQVREGLRYVARTPELRAPLLALALITTLAFTMRVSVPTLVRQSFAGGPAQLGAALTALSAGSLTGTLVRAARGMPGPRALPLAAAIMACGLAATAVAPVLPAVLAGLAATGIGWSYFLATVIATLQSADPRMLGRVMSLFALVLLGGTSAGAPVASSLSASLGPRAPFVTGTAAAIAALAVAAGSTRTASTKADTGSARAQGRPGSGTRPPILGCAGTTTTPQPSHVPRPVINGDQDDVR
jgi:MFS family permease